MSYFSTRVLIQTAMMTALAVVLDKLAIYQMPEGGSVTLVMLPLLMIAFRFGARAGLFAGGCTGLLQLIFGGHFLNPIQVTLDYLLAYSAVGIAGFCRHKTLLSLSLYSILASLARLFWHVLAGIVFYADYAPEETPVWIYSLTYNLSYMLPSTVLTLLILLTLYKRKPLWLEN